MGDLDEGNRERAGVEVAAPGVPIPHHLDKEWVDDDDAANCNFVARLDEPPLLIQAV